MSSQRDVINSADIPIPIPVPDMQQLPSNVQVAGNPNGEIEHAHLERDNQMSINEDENQQAPNAIPNHFNYLRVYLDALNPRIKDQILQVLDENFLLQWNDHCLKEELDRERKYKKRLEEELDHERKNNKSLKEELDLERKLSHNRKNNNAVNDQSNSDASNEIKDQPQQELSFAPVSFDVTGQNLKDNENVNAFEDVICSDPTSSIKTPQHQVRSSSNVSCAFCGESHGFKTPTTIMCGIGPTPSPHIRRSGNICPVTAIEEDWEKERYEPVEQKSIKGPDWDVPRDNDSFLVHRIVEESKKKKKRVREEVRPRFEKPKRMENHLTTYCRSKTLQTCFLVIWTLESLVRVMKEKVAESKQKSAESERKNIELKRKLAETEMFCKELEQSGNEKKKRKLAENNVEASERVVETHTRNNHSAEEPGGVDDRKVTLNSFSDQEDLAFMNDPVMEIDDTRNGYVYGSFGDEENWY